MKKITKSEFMTGYNCPKSLFLQRQPNRIMEPSANLEDKNQGMEVELLARKLFPGGASVQGEEIMSSYELIAGTAFLLSKKTPVIYEASFMCRKGFCKTDILRMDGSGIHVFEVKSTCEIKDQHIIDCAFQRKVISQAGWNVASISIIHLNPDYVRNGDLDLQQLFVVEDVTQRAIEMEPVVEAHLNLLYKVLESDTCPDTDIGIYCDLQEITSLDQVETPSVVYKYRNWENSSHKTILTQRQIFFSPPSLFEDPLDCKNHVRYDLLSKEQIYKWCYKHSTEDIPEHRGWSHHQHRKFVRDWMRLGRFKDKIRLTEHQRDEIDSFNHMFGVLSLTANPINNRMWEDYGEQHTGFCVGFHSQIIFPFCGGGGPVDYDKTLPNIYPEPIQPFHEQHRRRVFFKLLKWKYEEEYRVFKSGYTSPSDQKRVVVLPINTYSEIILGSNMSQAAKDEITIIARKFPNITLRQATFNNGVVSIINL